ncbi:MAG TPA: cytochrome P450 [Candidatus Binataceae bacterium]|nr:cytochrome P450 [Candidatus Binataceae bacterium]
MKPEQIDLTDLDFFVNGDVNGAFRVLREQDAVHWQERQPGRGFWSLTRYDDVVACYRDTDNFSSEGGVTLFFGDPGMGPKMGSMMILVDPPRHPKMRQLVSYRFTPRAIAAYEPRVMQIVTEIIDSVIEKGECDFVVDIAARMPTATICELMGISREHWPMLFANANETVGRHDEEYARGRTGRETFRDAQATATQFFMQEIEKRRRNPTDDLISALAHGSIKGDALSLGEMVANCWVLVLGGQETTRNATSGAMLAMIEHPEERAKFAANPSSTAAIEEFLRWTSPVTHMMRTAKCDVEIQGRKIKAGQHVVLWNVSANRDESQFEDPDRFDLARDPNEHVAFGHGEHFCLGAHLARLQMRLMLGEVVRRIPDLELAAPVERLRSNFIAGIKHMPVRFTPRAASEGATAAAK